MLELYHNDMSTCAQKVRMALVEKDLGWTSHHLSLRVGDTLNPDYLKLNPNGVVPTLVHNGAVIIESTVINEYIDDAFEPNPLKPSSPVDRARMRLWTKKPDEGLHIHTSTISSAIAFRYQFIERGHSALKKMYAAMPDPAKRERRMDLIENGIKSALFPTAIRAWEKTLGDMNKALADQPWLAGSQFTLADIAFAPYMTRWDHLQIHGLWSDKPHLANWYEKIKVRESYRTGLAEWFNDEYLQLMNEKGTKAWAEIRSII